VFYPHVKKNCLLLCKNKIVPEYPLIGHSKTKFFGKKIIIWFLNGLLRGIPKQYFFYRR